MLSQRTKKLKASPTLSLLAKAKELAAQGNDVVMLTVGEPDWETFAPVSEAGIEAIQKGMTKYTPANGTVELRKVISQQVKNTLGIDYSLKQVMVSGGAKFAIFSALQVLCDEGDEVVIGAPYWVSYPTMIELASATPKIVQCPASTKYKLTAELLEKAISEKTKVFLYCSPSNPTGLAYSKEELEAIAQVLRRHPRVIVISDDMYNRLMLDGSEVSPHLLSVAPDLKDRVIAINGGSKAYSMTGWRIGWAVGPENIITAMADYQSQATGAPSSIAQFAAITAIEKTQALIEDVNKTLVHRSTRAMELFAKISDMKVIRPDGAFYLWVDISKCLGKSYQGQIVDSSKVFCDILLEKFFVSIIPGIECGSEGFVRLSFAAHEDQMAKAIQRISDFVSSLK